MRGPWMGLKKAAEYCDATPRGFDDFVRRHRVPFVKYGRHRKFSAEILDHFMELMADRPEQLSVVPLRRERGPYGRARNG